MLHGSKSMRALQEASAAGTTAAAPAAEDYAPVQRWAVALSTHPDFELAIILLIFANCLTLALFRPLEAADSPWNKHLEKAGARCAAWAPLGVRLHSAVQIKCGMLCEGAACSCQPACRAQHLRRPGAEHHLHGGDAAPRRGHGRPCRILQPALERVRQHHGAFRKPALAHAALQQQHRAHEWRHALSCTTASNRAAGGTHATHCLHCPACQVAAGYTTFIPMGDHGGAGLEGVRALRALRALRPLRTITR